LGQPKVYILYSVLAIEVDIYYMILMAASLGHQSVRLDTFHLDA